MDDDKILVKGTPTKNTFSFILIILGIITALAAVLIASRQYQTKEFYQSFGFGYGLWVPYNIDYSFSEFFFKKFFTFSLYYGYILILGVVAILAGIILKANTEKCEITVTVSRVFGKLANGKEVSIPLNKITGIHTCSFKGISIASIGLVSNFYCLENHEDVRKALSYLLTNTQQGPAQSTQANIPLSDNNEAEQLKRFKELFDSGIITQEEFDVKKKQLLGL